MTTYLCPKCGEYHDSDTETADQFLVAPDGEFCGYSYYSHSANRIVKVFND